jgi:4-hydroxy-tetrahydrodipicolinate synthase
MDLSLFKGTGVALVTPFKQDGTIDYQGMSNLLKYTADNGVDYWVVQGTTGESPTVTDSEKKELLSFVIDNNPQGLPIVYGIGGNSTSQVIDLIQNTDLKGVDAVLSASPYYNKPSQEGIIKHYEMIADASPVPVILYNVPGRTASNLSSDSTLQLALHPNIIGIKEASGNIEQAMEIMSSMPKDFFLTSGDDLLTVSLMSLGSVGAISVLANGFPTIFSQMVNGCLDKDFTKGSESAFRLLEINPLMYEESNPVGIKEVLAQLDICENYTRMPLLSASSSLQNKIETILKSLK